MGPPVLSQPTSPNTAFISTWLPVPGSVRRCYPDIPCEPRDLRPLPHSLPKSEPHLGLETALLPCFPVGRHPQEFRLLSTVSHPTFLPRPWPPSPGIARPPCMSPSSLLFLLPSLLAISPAKALVHTLTASRLLPFRRGNLPESDPAAHLLQSQGWLLAPRLRPALSHMDARSTNARAGSPALCQGLEPQQ